MPSGSKRWVILIGNIKDQDQELLFEQSIKRPLEEAAKYKCVNLVVGVPFYNETHTLPLVLKVVEDSLFPTHKAEETLITCVGDPAGEDALEAVKQMDLSYPHLEFLMLPGINGRGMSIRAILEVANKLDADLLLLTADSVGQKGSGLQVDSIPRLLDPLQQGYDLVLTTFQRQYYEDLLGNLFLRPLFETFYRYRISDPLCGIYAISHDLVEDYCTAIKFWVDHTRGFGIDPWLITTAIIQNKRICEVPLGFKMEPASLDKLIYLFKDFASFMFERIKRDEEHWSGGKCVLHSPDICGLEPDQEPPTAQIYETRALIHQFRNGFNQYYSIFAETCPRSILTALERSAVSPSRDFYLDEETWVGVVYSLLFHYSFSPDASKEDVLDALTAVFCGRMASFLEQLENIQEELAIEKSTYAAAIIASQAEHKKEEQRRCFLQNRSWFIKKWREKAWEHKPPIIPADYLEFIPGKPIVLPKTIQWRGQEIKMSDLFNRLQNRYTSKFQDFLEKDLLIPADSNSRTIASRLEQFMGDLEQTIDQLCPGNVYTEEGAREVVDAIFDFLEHPKIFGIKEEIFEEAVIRFPPLNIMIPANCHTPRELLDKLLPRDAITIANLIETRKWADRTLLWILDKLTPEDITEIELKPLFAGSGLMGNMFKLGKISDLNKLTTRLVVSPLSKGIGGKYPKLRFFLFIMRQIMIAHNYSLLYETYAKERRNLGAKIRNSLIGRFESTPFSAYNIFENYHHRALVRKIRILAQHLTLTGHTERAQLLKALCNSYGVSQVLEDGTFIPCSAWTWASYSSKGGTGIPTPLSSHVEERWFNHDFLEEIHSELGLDPGEILPRITQSIGEGKADDDLLDVLLGVKPKDVTVVAQETQDYPPAKTLIRYSGNPILSPIKENPWESKYVLNAAAVRLEGRVYLLYRAYGDDEVSRIGLAVTDGYKVLDRLDYPIFSPRTKEEKKGVEDPRVVIIDDVLYMLYTAYDGVTAQIAAASIPVDAFLNREFHRWQRLGLAFQDIWDKDAILFPEKIRGKYVIYHRIEPSIWVSFMDKLEFPAPKGDHTIIMGPRPGKMWDFLKIGAGAQPIKTKYGWLMIYHGVDKDRVYRLGVMVVPLDQPERVIYRSPNPILTPETEYEIGRPGESWVPNVVFTCGAVPAEDKEILEAEDEILVYYGAADTHVCLATGRVGELIPEEIRENQARP